MYVRHISIRFFYPLTCIIYPQTIESHINKNIILINYTHAQYFNYYKINLFGGGTKIDGIAITSTSLGVVHKVESSVRLGRL